MKHLDRYTRIASRLGNLADYRKDAFADMVERHKNAKCMQVGVRHRKYSPAFISIDKYDTSELIDFNYDVHDTPFDDNTFDLIVCNAILEHVEYPHKAVAELHRILKVGGEIWVEIPFNQPYHPSPGDFWRVTPEGMLILMQEFEPIKCGNSKIDGSDIYNLILFHGTKI